MFSHVGYDISTQIMLGKPEINVRGLAASEEKSSREESGIGVSGRVGDDAPLQATEGSGQRENSYDGENGRPRDVRATLAGSEGIGDRKVMIWSRSRIFEYSDD